MQNKLSRRKLAQYAASRALDGKLPANVLRDLAAYLVENKRVRELELVVRSIEEELADRGIMVANVTTARPISDDLRQAVAKTLSAKHVYLREIVDPSVVGGVRIDTPNARLDSTIKRKLMLLRSKKQ